MKKLLVLVAVLAFGAVQADAIVNGGFEDGTVVTTSAPGWSYTGWTQMNGDTGVWVWGDGAASLNTTDSHSGLASADFYTGNGWSGGAGVFQAVAVGAGVDITISAYAKGLGGGGAGIDIVFFDAIPSETVQNPANLGRIDLAIGNFGAADENGWRFGSLSGVTPAGTQCVKFEIQNNGGTGHLLYDDVIGVPEPMTMVLLGLGGLFLRRKK